MAKQPMPQPTNSQAAPTEPQPQTWLERLQALLDPDFPSAVVPGPGLLIDDPALYGKETLKPDFVARDDANFTGKQ